MDTQNRLELLSGVTPLIKVVGKGLWASFGCCASSCKANPHDLVTDLDRSTEEYLNIELEKLCPEIGFEGEEFGLVREGSGNCRWLVDPIDGTFHYVRGIPHATTMLALVEEGVVTLGVIYNFYTGELFSAVRDCGAHRNDKRIQVSQQPLFGSCISVEMNIDAEHIANRDLYFDLHSRTMIYHSLSSGYEFGLVAQGKLDGRICYQPYGTEIDFAAGSLLVHEAGGVVRNIGSDQPFDVMNTNMLAVNPIVYRELTEGDNAPFPIQLS